MDSSPWSASASIHVTLGANGFAGRSSSVSPPAGFAGLGRYDASGGAASIFGPSPRASAHRGPFPNADDPGETEDGDLFSSSFSPSAYVRRLQREMERNSTISSGDPSGRYRFRTTFSASGRAAGGERGEADVPFGGAAASSYGPSAWRADRSRTNPVGATPYDPVVDHGRNAAGGARANFNVAGRSAETALEIFDSDSDDDDVVEVVAVGAAV